jgi:hypothetical protein
MAMPSAAVMQSKSRAKEAEERGKNDLALFVGDLFLEIIDLTYQNLFFR